MPASEAGHTAGDQGDPLPLAEVVKSVELGRVRRRRSSRQYVPAGLGCRQRILERGGAGSRISSESSAEAIECSIIKCSVDHY